METTHRVLLQPAFVLHTRRYRETSLLAEAFTREHGRVGVVAKGARAPRSRLRAVLQPFCPLLLSWSGRGDLGLLIAAEPDGAALPLDGRSLLHGLYVNELLLRLLHRHDPHPDLYDHHAEALDALRRGAPAEPVLRVFEKRLLDAIGYGLLLEHEVDSGRDIAPDRSYRYRPDAGPLLHAAGAGEGVDVSGATLLALGAERLDDERALREAKRLMRSVLATHLGPRPLASRDLFRRRSARRGATAVDRPD